MEILKLNKQKHDDFEMDELYQMFNDLNEYLHEDEFNFKSHLKKNLNTILDFQDSDGSFKLLDSFNVLNDSIGDYWFIPSYFCCVILMRAFMTDCSTFSSREKSALQNGLKFACSRNLTAHGYEGFSGQIYALYIFMAGGIREFMDLYSDFCPEFGEMICKIISNFRDMESHKDFLGPSGKSYESKIKDINEYFSKRRVFVYGTLMKGENNHNYLQNSTFLNSAIIYGYDMYDVGCYPAIVRGENEIYGELYSVSLKDLEMIDMLEGEGHLYTRRCERVTDSEGYVSFAFIYLYLGDVSKLKKISRWRN